MGEQATRHAEKEWLTDEFINGHTYLENTRLQAEGHRALVSTTFSYAKLFQDGGNRSGLRWVEARFLVDNSFNDIILCIPINIGNLHWVGLAAG